MKRIENNKKEKNNSTIKDQYLSLACSAVTLTSKTGKHYWFRTCDIENNLWEEGAHVICQAAEGTILYGNGRREMSKYSFLGVTYNANDTWLLDGVNEEGLTGGLLMLYEGTSVKTAKEGMQGYIGMELVTKLISSCKNVEEVKEKAKQIQVLDVFVKKQRFPATIHYFFTDKWGNEVILEAADEKNPGILQIYEKEEILGIMTNSPPYPQQVKNLAWYLAHSPEMNQGINGQKITNLSLDGRIVKADKNAKHLSATAVFPASYCSYDRFLRLAVLKALNDSGNQWKDEEMLAKGSALMNVVTEPDNKGIFHYTRIDEQGKIMGQKKSYTQYLIMYDIEEKRCYLKAFEQVSWTRYNLKKLQAGVKENYEVKMESLQGILTGN